MEDFYSAVHQGDSGRAVAYYRPAWNAVLPAAKQGWLMADHHVVSAECGTIESRWFVVFFVAPTSSGEWQSHKSLPAVNTEAENGVWHNRHSGVTAS